MSFRFTSWFCLAALAAAPTSVRSDCTVDQEQALLGSWIVSIGQAFGSEFMAAQAFQTGADGILGEVHLHGGISTVSTGTGPLLVEILPTVGGAPSGSALLSQTVPFASLPAPGSPADFVVDVSSHGLALESGTVYALVLSAASGEIVWRCRGGNPYAAGALYSRELPGGAWETVHSLDGFFRTVLCSGAVSAAEGFTVESWTETKARYR